ncbi:MAG: FAD-dependent oxidoreductase [Balneolales bacterium]
MLGAGLAGLSLADFLNNKGYRVLIIEKSAIGSGASGTPVGLVNPATGRKANLSWEAAKCHCLISENLSRVQEENKQQPFFSRSGVLRPAIDDETYANFRKAYERDDWPDGWCSWMSADGVRKANPYLIETKGGLLIHAGLSVRVLDYLKAYAKVLERKNVTQLTQQNYQLIPDDQHWKIKSDESGIFKTASVIFACGHAVVNSPYWREIPLHPVKGQISKYTTEERLKWDIPIAASGYFARSGENEYVTGGTYEHDFADEQFDKKGLSILENKLRRTMPSLLEKSVLTGQWAGIRASTPNRLPVIGSHQQEPNLYIFSGLGSKGLLYSKYTAQLLGAFLVDGKQLPPELNISRLSANRVR